MRSLVSDDQKGKCRVPWFIPAAAAMACSAMLAFAQDSGVSTHAGDSSRATGPWVDTNGGKDFLLTIPHVFEGSLEGGEVHGKALPPAGGNIPPGGIASPLFGASPFDQQLLLFEEFGPRKMAGTQENGVTLPVPSNPAGFPNGPALDAFLGANGFERLPGEYTNTADLNPWQTAIESFLGRRLQTPPMDGRPPGSGWAHQRWAEFPPEVYFKTAQTGARVNSGFRDSLQRHKYQKGEFAQGGLYWTSYATDDPNGPRVEGTTSGIPPQFHPKFPVQRPTSLWTFDGTFPPKLLMGRYGEPILMRHYNALPIDPGANNGFGLHTITTHEHNGHNPAESDGFAGGFYFPGQYWDYRWPMALAGYDTVNTTASDSKASFPADPGEQIFVNDRNPGLRPEQNGRINLRGDWRETMSTHWFHDHMIDHTAENVYKGNAAMFNYYSALDRGNEAINDGVNLRFPSGTALGWGNRDYDVNLVIADKAWDAEGQLFFNPFDRDGFLGDRMTVNWQWSPYLNVRHRSYRFRILNGAVARYFKIALVKQVQGNAGEFQGPSGSGVSYNRIGFYMIANDGNILEHSIPFDGSRDLNNNGNANEHRGLLPTQGIAERYDIIIDFASQGINPGDKLYFVNTLEHQDGRGPKGPVPLSDILSERYVARQSNGIWDQNDPAVGKFLEFRVADYTGQDLSMRPVDFVPGAAKMIPLSIDRNALGNPIKRTFEFERGSGTDNSPWTIKVDGGVALNADTRRVSAAPRMATGPTAAGFDGTNAAGYDATGTLEQWTLSGGGGWDHPVHIHFEEGVILSKDGKFPPVWEQWARKDIYRIGPTVDSAREITIALRFREFAGTFVEHCHNTVHEDHSMLLRWDIEHPGQVKVMPSPLPSWDGVEYVDSAVLPTFRSGINRPRLPDSNPFLSPVINSFSGISSGGTTNLSWEINKDSGDNIIALDLSPGIGSVMGRTVAEVHPTQATIYRLTATSPGGVSTATITVSPDGRIDNGNINNGGVPGTNLLTNADFGAGLDDWLSFTTPTGSTVATVDGVSGSAAVSLMGSTIYRTLPVEALSQYLFSAMYRNIDTPAMTMGMEFFDSAGTSLDRVEIHPGAGSSYQTANVRAKAPSGAFSAMIFFQSDQPGSTFVDNVVFARETIIAPTEPAQYRIKFTGLFTRENHPSASFPAVPHFSPLFAATHTINDNIWSEGTEATVAVRHLAETGDVSALSQLINAEIGHGFGTYVLSPEVNSGNGEVVLDVTATAEHPFLSLITQIAPSPDWLTGLDRVDLADVDGAWKPSIQLDLFPYDGGSDSGTTYEASNVITIPQSSIQSLRGMAPFSNNPIGHITITRVITEPVIKGDNLLTNGGFEEGFAGWNTFAPKNGKAVLTSVSANGQAAAELTGAFIYRSVPVLGGTSYALAAQYLSTVDVSRAMGIEFFDASGKSLLIKEVSPPSNLRYESVVVSAAAPAGASVANIYFWSDENGVTKVDDFDFHTVSSLEVNPDAAATSLLSNGGFENGLNSWTSRNLAGKKSIIKISPVSYKGASACELAGGLIHQSVVAKAGLTYSLTGSYQTGPKDTKGEVGISFLNAKGKELAAAPLSLLSSVAYRNFSVEGVAPADTVQAKVYGWEDGKGGLLLDDLVFTASKESHALPPQQLGPSVTLTANAPNSLQPFTVRVLFSESVAGLTTSDFAIANGSIGGFSQASASQYFLTVSALKNKKVSIFLPAGSATNALNQGNRESNILEVDQNGNNNNPNPIPDPLPNPDPIPDPVPVPESLKTRNIPEPSKLTEFIKDKNAAIELGKALFWDMQVGSDLKTSCATCHFQAGADSRIKNQVNPGLLRVESSGTGYPDTTFQVGGGGPNYTLKRGDYPFHKLSDVNDRNSAVVSSINDVTSSQGVFLEDFGGLNAAGDLEFTNSAPDDIFRVKGINTRRVEPRNTPTVINAIFNLRNFWDGRAQDNFNGINPFGRRDEGAFVWKATSTKNIPEKVKIELDKASLASQAVGPPLSSFEMSAAGKTFPELGRRLLKQRPLSLQIVHREDSILGKYSRSPKEGINISTYEALIKQAFQPEWWQGKGSVPADAAEPSAGTADTMGLTALSKKLKENKVKVNKKTPSPTEFTHMEANFSLYFGLAIQLYEATLVSDQTPFDAYAEGDANALTAQQKEGLNLFFGKAKCANCHGGAEFTNATVHHIQKERLERMIMGDNNQGVYDSGFYNIGVRPTLDDPGVGGVGPFGFPLSESRLARQFGRDVFETVIGVSPNIDVWSGERVAADGAFKTPTLRNIELTAPYFHNGGKLTLLEVVDFYNRGGDFHDQNIANLDPEVENLNLSEIEKESLVAFLKSLTDERVRNRRAPFDHPQLFVPNGHDGDQSNVVNDGKGSARESYLELPATGAKGGAPFRNFLE